MTHDEIRALATAAKARANAAQLATLVLAPKLKHYEWGNCATTVCASADDVPALADAVLGLLDEIGAADLHHDSEIRHWAEVTGCPPGVTLAGHLAELAAVKRDVERLEWVGLTFKERLTQEMARQADAWSERDQARAELEQVRVKLAGCLCAADGATTQTAKQGDYGWSPAYQATLDLRVAYDAAIARAEQAEADARTLAEACDPHCTWTDATHVAIRRALAYPEVKP